MNYKQEPPFAVQVELVEGCNLRCSFCGLNGIRHAKVNDFKMMTSATLHSLMKQMHDAGWHPRVEFAMHGEPTMHDDYAGMVRTAREAAPGMQLMMTSNGGGLLTKPGIVENIKMLFESGLNVLALDDYEGIRIVQKVRDRAEDLRDAVGMLDVYEYPDDPKGSPHARRQLKSKSLVFIQDIGTARKGNHSLLNNHAGAGAPPLKEPMQARCAKPFREMSVRWDGNVAICCNDWRGVYKCGNVVTDGLDKVWRGPAFDAARRELMVANRNFGPCKGCDATSYRLGLLPDKFGKVKLSAPSSVTRATLRKAMEGAPYTQPVKREWEG